MNIKMAVWFRILRKGQGDWFTMYYIRQRRPLESNLWKYAKWLRVEVLAFLILPRGILGISLGFWNLTTAPFLMKNSPHSPYAQKPSGEANERICRKWDCCEKVGMALSLNVHMGCIWGSCIQVMAWMQGRSSWRQSTKFYITIQLQK